MKHKNLFFIFPAVIVLLLASLACGSSNEGTVITPAPQDLSESEVSSDVTQPEEEKPAYEIYEVGDLIEVKEHTIRLNSIEYQGSVLVANFTLENHGSSDLNVSSILSFSAKKADGTSLEQEFFDCGNSALDGSVLPGDKVKGDICWSGANPDSEIKIYYESNLFSQGAVVWNAIEGIAEEINTDSGSAPKIEVFHIGDIVQSQDHSIRLNDLEYQGNILIADFSIENFSDSDVDISSMLSFSAKKEDGTLLEAEYFDCGTSGLDGKVLPGDRLRGSICWTGASAEDGIKIYYEANIFGEGAIVWEAIAGTAEPLEFSESQLKIDTFKPGDIIQIKDSTIILNTVEFIGNMLKANFTIENQGASDLNVSSMLSFYARKRDGSSLNQEYFNCGTSLDGSILPGDKLRGDICWSNAALTDGIKIYYEEAIISHGAVVWIIE